MNTTNHWFDRMAAARYYAPDDLQVPKYTAGDTAPKTRHPMPHSRLSTVGSDNQ
ncbi:hypothetical protein ACKFRT_04460 [Corynebacterium sp. YSMAA1_1_F7]|uniref:hypothetical protein n=1 Tax=Corynebacterium sp. YSMAA1_1_F7 TaxID=3383590 RepID=UPI0038CF6C87